MSERQTPHRRQSTLDEQTMKALERRLSNRPEKEELVDRNILKEDNVAPALAAAKERLQRSQLEDKISQALQQRSKPEDLVNKGIIAEDQFAAASA